MKILLILIVFAFSFIHINSQTVWEKVNPFMGQFARFQDVRCFDNLNCIGIVENTDTCCDRIVKTTDGGKTWFTHYHEKIYNDDTGMPIFPNPMYMNSIDYLSEKQIYISRSRGKLFKSTDGGITFDTIQVVESIEGKNPSGLYSLDMYDSLVGGAISNSHLYITDDGWKTSKNLSIEAEFIPDDYQIIAHSFIYSGKNQITVYFRVSKEISKNNYHVLYKGLITSINSGETWYLRDILKDFNARSVQITSLFFLDSKIGWASGQVIYDTDNGGRLTHGLVYKTYDSGITWDLIHVDETEPTFGLWDIAFYDELNGIVVGKYGKLLRTTDGGYTWFRDAFLDNYSQNMRVVQKIAFAGEHPILSTFSDGLWRGTYTPSSVNESKEAGKGLSLYPNPTMEYITITKPSEGFEPSEGSEVKIFNMLGECVMTVETRHVESLQRINISHLPRGVYYVRMGNRTEMFVKM
ncbi:MAG: YCF48-related protein [Candidatus Kapabacteria bacterium]|nr:YCF48-related protein [Candidatus Kapabacteria bacterium]